MFPKLYTNRFFMKRILTEDGAFLTRADEVLQ